MGGVSPATMLSDHVPPATPGGTPRRTGKGVQGQGRGGEEPAEVGGPQLQPGATASATKEPTLPPHLEERYSEEGGVKMEANRQVFPRPGMLVVAPPQKQ
jgi:hypothetical protein